MANSRASLLSPDERAPAEGDSPDSVAGTQHSGIGAPRDWTGEAGAADDLVDLAEASFHCRASLDAAGWLVVLATCSMQCSSGFGADVFAYLWSPE